MESGKAKQKRNFRHRRRFYLGILIFLLLGAVSLRRLWRAPASRPAVAPPAPAAPTYPDPVGIVLHASDTPAKMDGHIVNAAFLERLHAAEHPSWAVTFEGKTYHIGYHYVILPNGTVEKGRPDHCLGAHARHHNDWLGICLIGGFSALSNPHWWPSTPTKAQMRALIPLCERLMSQYHISPERVKPHRDVSLTWCPGGRFPYRKIMKELRAYAAAHPETGYNPPRIAHNDR